MRLPSGPFRAFDPLYLRKSACICGSAFLSVSIHVHSRLGLKISMGLGIAACGAIAFIRGSFFGDVWLASLTLTPSNRQQ
jgi:hypothetical protein